MVKLVENDYEWIPAGEGEIPSGAFVGGEDHNGDLFIGRVDHNNDLLPGKINQEYKLCYIGWGGLEHEKSKYQVLCGKGFEWVSSSGNNVPAGAVPGGFSKGEVLYIGRAPHMGTLPIGRVQPSHGVCYISYGGNEFSYPDYEILVHKSS
ncbi:uncharacterized protein LOC124157923 [Ischnura elegans]|uniref:uncharacterized protein LOC124157923 n=1 Tax=Ischnura elegans TaxID=197161 RepID=UPI001ED86CD8|nr:uncharacterized protein LOC124157923 [Ischnura elegans]